MQLVDSKCKGRLNLKEKEGFNIRLNLAGGNYWYNMRGTTGTTWGEPEVQQRTQRLTDRKLTLGCEFPLWKYNLQPGSISVTSKRRIWVIIGKNFQQCFKNLCFSWFWFGVGRFSADWRTISASTLVINVLKADPTYAATAIIITITASICDEENIILSEARILKIHQGGHQRMQ